MARIRTIKPEVWEDERFASLTMTERVVWFNRLTQADDEGRFVAAPVSVSASVNPFKPPRPRLIGAAIKRLEDVGLISLYEVGGCQYGYFPLWKTHQRIDKPQKARYPSPTRSDSHSRNGSENQTQGDSTGDPIRSDPISPLTPRKRGDQLLRKRRRGGSPPQGHPSWDAYFGQLALTRNCTAEEAEARWAVERETA